MSMRDTMKSFWSRNFVEIIRPLSASTAFMGEDEDDMGSDLSRGFNWSAAPVTTMEPAALEAQLAQLSEPPLEHSLQMPAMQMPALQAPAAVQAPAAPIAQAPAAMPAPTLELTVSEMTGVKLPIVESLSFDRPVPTAAVRDFSLPVALRDVVGANGAVDFDKLFKSAALPDAPITAEQGAWILNMLPTDLPLRVRRISARSSLEAISKFDSQAATDSVSHLVSDAALKMLYVSKLVKEMTAQVGTQRQRAEAEIALLEAEVQARRATLTDGDQNLAIAEDACQARMAKFNDVIQFFDHADFAQDGQALTTVGLDSADSMDAPLRMVGGAFK